MTRRLWAVGLLGALAAYPACAVSTPTRIEPKWVIVDAVDQVPASGYGLFGDGIELTFAQPSLLLGASFDVFLPTHLRRGADLQSNLLDASTATIIGLLDQGALTDESTVLGGPAAFFKLSVSPVPEPSPVIAFLAALAVLAGAFKVAPLMDRLRRRGTGLAMT